MSTRKEACAVVIAAVFILSLSLSPSAATNADLLAMRAPTNTGAQGSLVGWGENLQGQVNVPGGEDYMDVSAGAAHSLALKSDGSIAGWGDNAKGQINVPVGNDFASVAAGGAHSLALKKDGSIAGWGDNAKGQTNVPVGNDFASVAAGGIHSLALKEDGSIVGWGDNEKGQINVPNGTGFLAVAAGGTHSFALKSDGSIVGWGDNAKGQINVPAGSDFTVIAAGGAHSLALKSDGSIAGWGDNAKGQINVPVGNDFTAIAAGGTHSLALKKDGSIVGWGDNAKGQIDVPNGAGFLAVAAGGAHSLAVGAGPAEEAGPTYYSIKASAGPGGTITPSGTVWVREGNSKKFTVAADPGYRVADVLVDGVSVGPACGYTFKGVCDYHTIRATFVSSGYTIVASAGQGGTITLSGVITVEGGSFRVFTITPDTGFVISDVLVDGVSVGPVSEYVFTDIHANHTIHVEFAIQYFTVTATVIDGYGSAVPETQQVPYGGTAQITITPATLGADTTEPGDNVIVLVTDNGVEVDIPDPTGFTYTITNVTTNHVVEVIFGLLLPILPGDG